MYISFLNYWNRINTRKNEKKELNYYLRAASQLVLQLQLRIGHLITLRIIVL